MIGVLIDMPFNLPSYRNNQEHSDLSFVYYLILVISLYGCQDKDLTSMSEPPMAGEPAAGSPIAGEMNAGFAIAGEISGGDINAGEMSGEEITAGDQGPVDLPPCGDGPSCPLGYQCECGLDQTCECFAPMNREGCDRNLVCRADETCREIEQDGLTKHVCWLDPSLLSLNEGRSSEPELPLFAGAASMIITPQGFETPKPEGLDGVSMNFAPPIAMGSPLWNDCGYDGLCPEDEGYVAPDSGEGDGQLQGVFLAGFHHGRPAQYCPPELIGCDRLECCVSQLAHDDLKAQVVSVRRGNLTISLVALDVVGLFHSDTEQIRRELAHALKDRPELGSVDHLVIGSSHSHEGPDTIGQYGPGTAAPVKSGRDGHWMAFMRSQVIQGVLQSLEALQPARAETYLIDEGIEGLGMSDSRTPYIYDDNIPVLTLSNPVTGAGIATLLSVANHTEFLWDDNPYLTSDYFHYTRQYIEEGLSAVLDEQGDEVKPELSGLGGVTVMFAGAVGGLINPSRGVAINYAGERFDDLSFAMADAAGQQIAARLLSAHSEGRFNEVSNAPANTPTTAPLHFAAQRFLTPIDNVTFLLAGYALRLIRRDIYNSSYQGGISFFPNNPLVMSEVTTIKLGTLTFFTAPGEVFPELLTGGYPDRPTVQSPVIGDVEEVRVDRECDSRGLPLGVEGSMGGSFPCLVRSSQTNPPDWSAAPQPPYGYDLIQGMPFFIGLGGDFLGYIIPTYDFQDGDAPGDHYEETNSAGARLTPDWLTALKQTLEGLSSSQ